MDDIRHRLAQLITSIHILHHQGMLQEEGTVSMRNRQDPSTFITSSIAPILISSPNDFSEWYVEDASPAQQQDGEDATTPISPHNPEIFVHSCMYLRYPGIQSIAHVRTIDLIVYGLCDAQGSMLRSVFNQAGFVDEYSPIFDPAHYRELLPRNHLENLRVDHPILGAALAETFSRSSRTQGRTVDGFIDGVVDGVKEPELPEHGVTFLRGNGAVMWAVDGLEELVYKCVNLQRNAKIQTAAMLQRTGSDLEITYLSWKEGVDCERSTSRAAIEMSWRAWKAAVYRSRLYVNDFIEAVV